MTGRWNRRTSASPIEEFRIGIGRAEAHPWYLCVVFDFKGSNSTSRSMLTIQLVSSKQSLWHWNSCRGNQGIRFDNLLLDSQGVLKIGTFRIFKKCGRHLILPPQPLADFSNAVRVTKGSLNAVRGAILPGKSPHYPYDSFQSKVVGVIQAPEVRRLVFHTLLFHKV